MHIQVSTFIFVVSYYILIGNLYISLLFFFCMRMDVFQFSIYFILFNRLSLSLVLFVFNNLIQFFVRKAKKKKNKRQGLKDFSNY